VLIVDPKPHEIEAAIQQCESCPACDAGDGEQCGDPRAAAAKMQVFRELSSAKRA
jgi:Zn-dependent alcohol dehydrogenase